MSLLVSVACLLYNTKVTPINEWWHFKRPPRQDTKMTVKEAEDLMKMQENFLGPLSLANKIIGKNSGVSYLHMYACL